MFVAHAHATACNARGAWPRVACRGCTNGWARRRWSPMRLRAAAEPRRGRAQTGPPAGGGGSRRCRLADAAAIGHLPGSLAILDTPALPAVPCLQINPAVRSVPGRPARFERALRAPGSHRPARGVGGTRRERAELLSAEAAVRQTACPADALSGRRRVRQTSRRTDRGQKTRDGALKINARAKECTDTHGAGSGTAPCFFSGILSSPVLCVRPSVSAVGGRPGL